MFNFFSCFQLFFYISQTFTITHMCVHTYMYYSNALDLREIRVTQDFPNENYYIGHRMAAP